ncbi:MAG: hypothetical protein HGA81_05750 [Chlorobium limicola]|jgi:hypothetical protein|uniref:hypothetical protein n=1 Tax=Chlorobium limicola TaxID=1092 RepID=UPI00059D67AB|nr:hypothetical protein [Chlorobium limicola]NTV08092.1 hypothetical protein [Chlorobium limicola]NTV20431.1 hypothetical protein [Chlorobium limicola]
MKRVKVQMPYLDAASIPNSTASWNARHDAGEMIAPNLQDNLYRAESLPAQQCTHSAPCF